MRVAACVTCWPEEWQGLKAVLEEARCTVVTHESPGELLHGLGSLDPDLFLVDSRTPSDEQQMLLDLVATSATVLLVRPATRGTELEDSPAREATPQEFYDSFQLSEGTSEQRRVIRRALERSQLLQKDASPANSAPAVPEPAAIPAPRPSDRPWELALRALSHSLSAGFHITGLLDPFVELACELANVARVAILTRQINDESFSIAASRGLFGPMLQVYPHPARGGIAGCLAREGRPLRREDSAVVRSPDARDIQRSFDVLQAAACVPLAASGELVGILAMGSCLNGTPPSDTSLEILFAIGGHIAVALQNIFIHQETTAQKARSERALEDMTYGVLAIDSAGRVSLFNRRAGEILQLAPQTVVGKDLRTIPAPLGDFLFGALKTGEVSRFPSLILPESGAPLEATAYPLLLPGSSAPSGSVLVIEDITQRLAIQESQKHADRQELFSALIAQLAHEIKNPLTAIKTFADLFQQHRSEPEFLGFVENTVLPEIDRLHEILGKLLDLGNHEVPLLRPCSIDAVLQDLLRRRSTDPAWRDAEISLEIDENLPPVRADSSLLLKAFAYLVGYLLSALGDTHQKQVTVYAAHTGGLSPRAVVELKPGGPWAGESDTAHLFDPLAIRRDHLNLALPVARKILQEHRGDVAVITNKGGIPFLRVTLPGYPGEDAGLSADMPDVLYSH